MVKKLSVCIISTVIQNSRNPIALLAKALNWGGQSTQRARHTFPPPFLLHSLHEITHDVFHGRKTITILTALWAELLVDQADSCGSAGGIPTSGLQRGLLHLGTNAQQPSHGGLLSSKHSTAGSTASSTHQLWLLEDEPGLEHLQGTKTFSVLSVRSVNASRLSTPSDCKAHTWHQKTTDSILKISQPPHHAKCCSPSYIPLHKVLQCVYKYTNRTLCIHLLGYYLCFTWSCHWEVTSAAAKQWVYKPKIKHTDTLIRYTKLLLFIQQIHFWCVKSLLKIYKPQLCLENTKVPHFKPGMKHELV